MKTKLFVIIAAFTVLLSGCNDEKKMKEEAEQKEQKRVREIMDKEKQSSLTVDGIIQQFKDGNERFLTDNEIQNEVLEQIKQTGTQGQFPKAIVLGCIDSRTPIESVFDKGIGDIF